MDNKYVINLFGKSCAGKTSVADIIQNFTPGLYTLDWDINKQQLSHYYWKNDSETIRSLSFGFFQAACTVDLPLLLLLPRFRSKQEFDAYQTYASDSGYGRIISIELDAPDEVLIKRYQKRLEDYWPSKKGIVPKTIEEFTKALHDTYYEPSNTVTFDSSIVTTEEIAQQILSIIPRDE